MDTIPEGHPLRRAPSVVTTSAELPEAEWLGTPEVPVLLGYTRRALHLPDGHTMALFSFSSSAPANWVFIVDARDLSSKRFAMPNNDAASSGS